MARELSLWCYTAASPKAFFLDANCLFPLLVWGMHFRMWTFYIAIGGVLFFWLLTRLGYSPTELLRRILRRTSGRQRNLQGWDRDVMRLRCRW